LSDGIIGLISTRAHDDCLQGLTEQRPLAAVPFCGRYRLIDFILSGMVNAGITNIGVLLQNKHRPLLDYLQSGKAWDLSRKRDGLVLLPPAYQLANQGLAGDLYTIYHNKDFLHKSQHRYVAIAGTGVICQLDFRQALAFHQQKRAQITVCTAQSYNQAAYCCQQEKLMVDQAGQVTAIIRDEEGVHGLDIAILERNLFIELVDSAMECGGQDFFRDCILPNLNNYHVFAYEHGGYAARIDCLSAFYRHNMDLLKRDTWQQLFAQPELIYTKGKDEPPAHYLPGARVNHSLVAGGCVVGGTVENSILFRGVHIQPGASVRNSILMNRTVVEQGAIIDTVICDKEARITAGKVLIGTPEAPAVVRKGIVM